MDAKTEVLFGEALEHAVTPNLRPGTDFCFTRQLNQVFRTREQTPLALRAAKTILEAAPAKLLFVTGFVEEALPKGETDGPVGAAVLAATVFRATNARPQFLTEPGVESVVQSCLQALQRDTENLSPSFETLAHPSEDTRRILSTLESGCLIAVEKAGQQPDGTYLSAGGSDLSQHLLPVHALFDSAAQNSVTSVSCVDAPNEVGMHGLAETITPIVPEFMRVAQTPCDHVVVGTTANWAAYAIAGAIAGLLKQPAAFPTPNEVRNAMTSALDNGAQDPAWGMGVQGSVVDGISLEVDLGVVAQIREILGWATEEKFGETPK